MTTYKPSLLFLGNAFILTFMTLCITGATSTLATIYSMPTVPAGTTQFELLNSFNNWLSEKKVTLTSVEISSTGVKGGLGLVATNNLAEKAVFVSIPLSTLINIEHVFLDSWAQQYLDPLSDTEAMALFIAKVRRSGNSTWNPYIQLLPDKVYSPLFYSDAQLAQLQQSTVRPYAARRLARARETYASLPPAVTSLISFDDFLWSLSILWSRSHGVGVKDSTGKWQKASCFVPVADLLNTADGRSSIDSMSNGETNNVDCHTNDESTHFQCFATRAITKGEELLVQYGPAPTKENPAQGLGNGQLLLDYGFTLEHNDWDVLAITLPGLRKIGIYPLEPEGQALIDEVITEFQASAVKSLLQRDSKSSNHTFQLPTPLAHQFGSKDEIKIVPAMLMNYARIWNVDQPILDELKHKFGNIDNIIGAMKKNLPLLPSLEKLAVVFLVSQLVSLNKSYGTTLQEDKALLARLPQLDDATRDLMALAPTDDWIATQIERMNLNLRLGEKRLISVYLTILVEYQRTMHRPARTRPTASHTRVHDEL